MRKNRLWNQLGIVRVAQQKNRKEPHLYFCAVFETDALTGMDCCFQQSSDTLHLLRIRTVQSSPLYSFLFLSSWFHRIVHFFQLYRSFYVVETKGECGPNPGFRSGRPGSNNCKLYGPNPNFYPTRPKLWVFCWNKSACLTPAKLKRNFNNRSISRNANLHNQKESASKNRFELSGDRCRLFFHFRTQLEFRSSSWHQSSLSWNSREASPAGRDAPFVITNLS